MNKFDKKNFFPFVIASVLLHAMVLFIFELLPSPEIGDFDSLTDSSAKALTIKKIKREYRNVGVQNGSKKHQFQGMQKNKFSSPKDQVDLSSLQVNPNYNQVKKEALTKKDLKRKSPFNYIIRKSTKNEKVVQQRFLKKITTDRFLDPVLSNSDFALNPELPEGVKFDQLNSAEKVYYSFKKRTLEQYLASFVDQYQTLKKTKPQIKEKLAMGRHVLSGRVTFDKNGNIVTIKIIKSSQDDDIHIMFEETLKGINKVPNPPSDFLTKNEQFSIFYILKIN